MGAPAEAEASHYHAMMLVTRAEEWCVDGASAEEAALSLAEGQGHRCRLGEVLDIALERMLETSHRSGRRVALRPGRRSC